MLGHSAEEIDQYLAAGHWSTTTLAGWVDEWARLRPHGLAFVGERARLTWKTYDEASSTLAEDLVVRDWSPAILP